MTGEADPPDEHPTSGPTDTSQTPPMDDAPTDAADRRTDPQTDADDTIHDDGDAATGDAAGVDPDAGTAPDPPLRTDGGFEEVAGDADVDRLQAKIDEVRTEVGKRIVGQRAVLDQLLACVLADGNALLESVPGLGKTSMVRTLASVTDLEFSRIQNTPDLMPSDITGTEIIRDAGNTREFVFEKGPVFANVVLADEINRATPKTQSALLEAMQERQVTASGETYELPDPFFILATQNPIDQSGTYALPEAQTDRFLLKILLDYPSFDEETDIVDLYTAETAVPPVEQVVSRDEIREMQGLVREVPVADDIRDRAVELVRLTREADRLEFGASPRASMALVLTGKAKAFMEGRSHVSWSDVEAMAPPVLRHRVIVDFRAEREGVDADEVVRDLLEEV
jgi:MoxR-like ATPase